MKTLLIKKTIYAASYIVLAIAIEMITFLAMGLGVFPDHIGLDLAVIFIFAFFIFIIPHSIAQLVVEGALLFVQIILSIANEALYAMSGTVFSFSMLNLMNEVTGVMDASFLNWWLVGGLLALFAAAVAGLITVTVKMRVGKYAVRRNALLIMLAAFLIVECMFGLLYVSVVEDFSASAEENVEDDELSIFIDQSLLYQKQLFPAKAFKEFGTFGYLVSNVKNAITSSSVSDDITEEQLDEYFADAQMSNGEYGENIYTGAAAGKNVVLIVIESGEWYGINAEYTPTLYAMAESGIAMTDYHSRDKTNVSEALSIMGSYPASTQYEPANVIGNSMPYAMPNILGQGGYTTNYFHANTRDFYDREVVFDNLYGFDNTYFLEDMPELKGNEDKDGFYDFDKDSDVFRYYLDNFTYSEGDSPFYTQMMTLITHGTYTDLMDYGNYPFATTPSAAGEKSEGTMSEEDKARFSSRCEVKGLEEYYSYIDSFPSTYVTGTDPIDEAYLEETGTYSEMFLRYKRYQAGYMDLDLSVNMLVNDLIEKGELEDTLFVFYADHSAYYDQMNYFVKGIDNSQSFNTDLYNVPFFIWYGGSMDLHAESIGLSEYQPIDYKASADLNSPLRSGMRIDKFCSTLDVMPTILDLLGYSYNTNLFHGASMFTGEERVFVSHESGIFKDDIYFSGINLFRKKDGEWVTYDFDAAFVSDSLDSYEMSFLYEVAEYYEHQAMLEAVVALDYFADRDFFGGIQYGGKEVTFIEKIA